MIKLYGKNCANWRDKNMLKCNENKFMKFKYF